MMTDWVVPRHRKIFLHESMAAPEETTEVQGFSSLDTVYYNESALKAKDRNALPDSEFGLPRIRAYPLHDVAHVKLAVNMFGHCKDPEDRKVLAKNIEMKIKMYGIKIKIGKGNPLSNYVDQSLTEATLPGLTIGGFEKPMGKRSKKDIIEEHIRQNGAYYNNIFYGNVLGRALKGLNEFSFLDFFYPDLVRMNFYSRLQCACGGLASSKLVSIIYDLLKIRVPYGDSFDKPLGWCSEEVLKQIQENPMMIDDDGSNYDPEANWFKVNLGTDINHSIFCLRLYSIMGDILLNPHFNPTDLTASHFALLADWQQKVSNHYDIMLTTKPDSKERLREMQYLFDLFWSFNDNPYSEDVILRNTIWVYRNMACMEDRVSTMNEANVPGELITKDQCSAYLVHDLGMPDDIFLLPGSLDYPVIDKTSVLLAMDNIGNIQKDLQADYAKNLNRRYKELGCTFSISVDHPYAKFADKNIIDHMTRTLLESDTAVDDEGTSTDGVDSDHTTQPWYKRFDTNDNLRKNALDNKELGPNKKETPNPAYTPLQSVY